MKRFYLLIILCLFLLNSIFYLYKSNLPELRGDEAASYLALVPFLQAATHFRFFPSFLQYFHEPIQLLVQIPFVFLGLSEFWVRFPNILSGILLFVILFKIGKQIFKEEKFPVVVLLCFYTLSGFFLLSRLALNIGLFSLLLSLFLLNPIGNKKSWIWLFLDIFTYIDAVFLFPGLILNRLLAGKRGLRPFFKNFIIFLAIIGVILGLNALVVYLGSVYSGAYSWLQAAPFRLFLRGASLTFFGGVNSNISTFNEILGTYLTIFLVALMIFSVFDRRAKKFWLFLLFPLIWLNLIPKPTVHLLHFYPFIVVLATIGWSFVWNHLTITAKIIWGLITVVVFIQSFLFLSSKLNKILTQNLKIIGTYVQNNSVVCDKVLTNIEGQTARLYFGRGYTTELAPETHMAVLENANAEITNVLNKNGFRQIDYSSEKLPIEIWIKEDVPKKLQGSYFGFSSLLPYIFPCSKISIKKFP